MLALSGMAQAGTLTIVANPASVQFGSVTDADGQSRPYMWFNVVLSDTGGYAKLGGLSMAATVSGPGASHLTAPVNFGTGGAQSAMRRSGSQWTTALSGYSFAFGTQYFTASTSAAIGTIGSGGRLTLAMASDDALVVPVAAGQVLARYYFGWDGQPLGGTVTINLISESGNITQGPSVFVDKGDGTVSLPEVFSAPSSITVGGATLAAHVTALTAGLDDWVYQNTATTLAAGGHQTSVTVVIDTANGNTTYAVTLTKTGGTGTVTFPSNGVVSSNLVKAIVGGDRPTDFTVSGVGTCTIDVSLHGVQSNETVDAGSVTINVRQLGDVNGDGEVDAGDKSAINAYLNGVVPDPTKAMDLNLDGEVDAGDKSVINSILNGAI
jgi:hypothetical protein